jgi:3-isopropylmalate dehydrogenase
MARIAILPGDGVGPEVMAEALRVLEVASGIDGLTLGWDVWDLGADRYLETGQTITEEEFQTLSDDYDAILLGALGDPRVPSNVHARDILLGLRFRLDLFVNYRPCRVLDPSLSPLKARSGGSLDVAIFRENTEGIYLGIGGTVKAGTPDEVAVEEDLSTWKGVERIIRAAFQFARDRGRTRVTLVDKANAMAHAGRLWRRAFQEVGDEFPEVEREAAYVDAVAMDLIRRPGHYDVVVTSNLFGDILSDLAAALAGGLGTAPSANIHPGEHALFEPVHGSAPDIAGQGIANPMGAILCVALLLEHLGRDDVARELEDAVAEAIREGATTADLGGDLDTGEVGGWIADRFGARLEEL